MKILILRFSSIGDIVLTTPVLRCLKKQTGAELHYLTKKRFADTLLENPHVDRLWTFDESLDEVLGDLRKERFDWVIDLHRNLRSRRVKMALGRPSRSFNKLNFEKWVLVRFKLNLLPDMHIVDRYLGAVEHLGVVNDGAGLEFPVSPAAEVSVGEWNEDFKPGAFIAFAIGANHATKRLTDDQIEQVCRQAPMPVVLIGGENEAATGEKVVSVCGPGVWNACGKTTLHQSASIIRQSAVVLTHDTGMMHIAAALHKPIVSVWGNTVPEFGMYPHLPEGFPPAVKLETPGLRCRPCTKIGFDACPRGHFDCIHKITAERIVEEITAQMVR